MADARDEMDFLESVAGTYVTSESSQDRTIKGQAVRTFKPFLRGSGTALEFGCCDGYMTSLIAPLVAKLTVVDGSQTFIEMAKRRAASNVEFVHALFQDYAPALAYDYIFATYVLEHVTDAVGFLKRARSLLAERGVLFVVVPNACALSRRLARTMGLLTSLYDLTPNDMNHGHRRVYDRVLLDRDIEAAGLSQIAQGGLMLKLLADFQMDKLIDSGILGEAQLEGLYKMGLELPEMAGSLYAVCCQRQP